MKRIRNLRRSSAAYPNAVYECYVCNLHDIQSPFDVHLWKCSDKSYQTRAFNISNAWFPVINRWIIVFRSRLLIKFDNRFLFPMKFSESINSNFQLYRGIQPLNLWTCWDFINTRQLKFQILTDYSFDSITFSIFWTRKCLMMRN